MGVPSRWESDLFINGTLIPKAITLPTNSVSDANIPTAAGIQANKITRHESINIQAAASGSAVVASTTLAHIVKGATGTIIGFQVATTTVATGGDRTVNVDLQKSTGGGAFATVLTAPALLNSSSTVRTAVAATISSNGLVTGDILEIIVTVAGAAGAQAAGLIVTLTIEETYQ